MPLTKKTKFRSWQFRYDDQGTMLPDVNVLVDVTVEDDGEVLLNRQLKRRITLTTGQITAIQNILNSGPSLKPWIDDSPPIFSQG